MFPFFVIVKSRNRMSDLGVIPLFLPLRSE
nr:MAG TPA: hypothetical protein [Caudoviricetes sp.]